MQTISELRILRRKLIDRINIILDNQVKLNLVAKWKVADVLIDQSRMCNNITYEKRRMLRGIFNKIESVAACQEQWECIIHLLKNDRKSFCEQYALSNKECEEIFVFCRNSISEDVLLSFPEDKVDFIYNVNDKNKSKVMFRDRSRLSMGQRAVAILLVILKAGYCLGDNRPLIIDQPEDDLDNVYIYSSLVTEFRKIKKKRQLIFATHNANIPIAGDAENILIMSSDGEYGEVQQQGSIDKKGMCDAVVKILEGGQEALELRLSKYGEKREN